MKEELLTAIRQVVFLNDRLVRAGQELLVADNAESSAMWEKHVVLCNDSNRATVIAFQRLAEYVEGLP